MTTLEKIQQSAKNKLDNYLKEHYKFMKTFYVHFIGVAQYREIKAINEKDAKEQFAKLENVLYSNHIKVTHKMPPLQFLKLNN